MNTRLSQLYGASVHSSVRKLGDYQVFGLAASGISSRYAFGGENMAEELCRILASMLFHPLLDKDGEFPEENFSQEKRQLLELKDAEFNDKVAYAHRRCEQLLFQGQPTGIDRYGSREDLAALKRQGLVDAWNEILDTARVELFVLGDCTAREAHAFGELFVREIRHACIKHCKHVAIRQQIVRQIVRFAEETCQYLVLFRCCLTVHVFIDEMTYVVYILMHVCIWL